jgi:hypothetical protein
MSLVALIAFSVSFPLVVRQLQIQKLLFHPPLLDLLPPAISWTAMVGLLGVLLFWPLLLPKSVFASAGAAIVVWIASLSTCLGWQSRGNSDCEGFGILANIGAASTLWLAVILMYAFRQKLIAKRWYLGFVVGLVPAAVLPLGYLPVVLLPVSILPVLSIPWFLSKYARLRRSQRNTSDDANEATS